MATTGVSGVSDDYIYASSSIGSSAPSQELDSTDFLKLLAAQLQYQDVTNPMSNSEMMSTLTDMSTMSSMSSMTTAVEQATSAVNDVLTVNLTSYATGMMGKDVTIALVDEDGNATGEKLTGKVEGVSLYEGSPMVYVDGKSYSLTQVMTIGDVSGESTEEDEDTQAESTESVNESEQAAEEAETQQGSAAADTTQAQQASGTESEGSSGGDNPNQAI